MPPTSTCLPLFVCPAFAAKIAVMGIQWQIHVSYHHQSSGQVERMTSTIKVKLTKIMKTPLNWPKALPIVLYSICSTQNATTGLSPYEVLMGQPRFTGASQPSQFNMDWWLYDWVMSMWNPWPRFYFQTQVSERLAKQMEEPIHPYPCGDDWGQYHHSWEL